MADLVIESISHFDLGRKAPVQLEEVKEGELNLAYPEYKKSLEKQGYRFVGEHSAVKICEWTAKSISGKGSCYKQKFYGIQSHRCAQVSVSVNFCDKDCVYCWRSRNNTPYTKIDDPVSVLKNIQAKQDKLLSGFGGNTCKTTEAWKYLESKEIKHYALSLTGETLSYPRLNEFIQEIKKRGKTSFVVTHGGFPEVMERMEAPTQLYLSIDAPTEELFNKVDRPISNLGWKKLLKSLDVLKNLKSKTRTVLRLTVVKGINMFNPEGYAELVKRGDPTFLEVKAFMLIGAARDRMTLGNMPLHNEVHSFAEEVGKYSGYKIIDEAENSRVVLMMKEDSSERFLKFEEQ